MYIVAVSICSVIVAVEGRNWAQSARRRVVGFMMVVGLSDWIVGAKLEI